MLGSEGWKPTAKEAVEAGLITEVVPHDQVQNSLTFVHLYQDFFMSYEQISDVIGLANIKVFFRVPNLELKKHYDIGECQSREGGHVCKVHVKYVERLDWAWRREFLKELIHEGALRRCH